MKIEKTQRRVLILLFLVVFIDLVGFGMIIPLLPYLGRQLGDSALKAGLLMSIYSVMQFLLNPLWGQISDRYGRRPILLMSLLGSTLSHLAFAFSTTFLTMFFARLFAGSFAANISAAMASMADISTKEERSKRMGLIGAAFGLGFTLGPFIGAFLGAKGQLISDAAPFGLWTPALAASILCSLNFIFAIFFLPETNQSKKVQTIGLGKKFENIFAYFKRPLFKQFLSTYGLNSLAMALMEMSLFLFVKDRFHLSLIEASYGFAYIGFILVFTQGYLIRKLLPRFGEAKLIKASLLIYGLAVSTIPFCYDLYSFAIAVTALSIAQGCLTPSLTGSLSVIETAKDQGQVMGVTQSLSALGRIIGPAIAGAIYAPTAHFGPFIGAGAMSLLGLLLVLKIKGPFRAEESNDL